MISDLHQHRDAFGIAGLCLGGLVRAGAELPAVTGTNDGDCHTVGTIGVNLQLCSRNRDEFGLGLGGLAHDQTSSRLSRMIRKRPAPHLMRGRHRSSLATNVEALCAEIMRK